MAAHTIMVIYPNLLFFVVINYESDDNCYSFFAYYSAILLLYFF
ncbi:Uncharacterised protein [Streptococcus anginosus]|uniref:Uncharacterized protein n=1 Tax=Streptococcus anginosus TaxID=1328 RepID=A0A4U9Z4K3_STRAP|nr:Uncharacterised protein [Streptococcus milleri]VTS34296.1 Uncharacterised protein [Streptococcus anginosus]